MGQCNPLNLPVLAELHHVFNRTMAPSNLGRILFGSVLRVVDEKIRAIDKFGASQILPSNFPVAACQLARVRFVVTGIHYRYPIGLQPITQRERWMIQILGGHFDIVDIEGALDEVVVANLSPELIEWDGEIWPARASRKDWPRPLGPYMSHSLPGTKSGAKKGIPWM